MNRINERLTEWCLRAVSSRAAICAAAITVGILLGCAQLGQYMNGIGL